METNLMSGTIWRGSNAQITLPLTPRCFSYTTAENIEINVYTEVSGASITYGETEMAISGNNATIVIQPVQLDALKDGIIRYNVAMDADGEHYVFDLETRWMLKTPNEYTSVSEIYRLVAGSKYKDLAKNIIYATKEERAGIISRIIIYSNAALAQYSYVTSYRVSGNAEVFFQCIYPSGNKDYIREYSLRYDDEWKLKYISTHTMLNQYDTLAETARTESAYQKVLTAGTGITIENNVISANVGDAIKVINFNKLDADERIAAYNEITALMPSEGIANTDFSHYRFFGAPGGYAPREMFFTDYDRTENRLKFSCVTIKIYAQRKINIADMYLNADGTFGWRVHNVDLSSLVIN